jgi:hypothetical protein
MDSPNPPYWFYHEYLDEHRRMRVNLVGAQTETEARRLHRSAADFHWVTQHAEPTVSSLFTKGKYGQQTIAPQQRPGVPYAQHDKPAPCPPEVKAALQQLRRRHAETLP